MLPSHQRSKKNIGILFTNRTAVIMAHLHLASLDIPKEAKMAAPGIAGERSEFIMSSLDESRGRKRRRSPPSFLTVAGRQSPSGESSTFRGRSRHRSASQIGGSRNASRLRDASLSPTRRKMMRIAHLINRHRSQSPSRSRSPNTQEPSKRRRQRTRSRGRVHRDHDSHKVNEHLSLLRHEIVIQAEPVDGRQTG